MENDFLIDIICLVEYYKHIKNFYFKKWFLEGNGVIQQSSVSFSFLWQSLFYPNSAMQFFLELVNLFQKLDCGKIYNQAFTTYALKLLARNGIIRIIKMKKEVNTNTLYEFKEILGNKVPNKSPLTMYDVYFYKVRHITKEDIPLLQTLANVLKVDFSVYQIKSRNKKVALTLKSKEIVRTCLNGEAYRKAIVQKEIFQKRIEYLKDELQDIKKEQYRGAKVLENKQKNNS